MALARDCWSALSKTIRKSQSIPGKRPSVDMCNIRRHSETPVTIYQLRICATIPAGQDPSVFDVICSFPSSHYLRINGTAQDPAASCEGSIQDNAPINLHMCRNTASVAVQVAHLTRRESPQGLVDSARCSPSQPRWPPLPMILALCTSRHFRR